MSNYRQTHRSLRNHTHHRQQQQRAYNPRNAPRRPNYQSSRRQHHNVHNNPHANYSSSGCNGSYTATDHHENVAPQCQDQNNHSPNELILSSPPPYNEQVDEVDVATESIMPIRNMLDYINYLTNLESNSRFNAGIFDEYVAYLLDEFVNDHDDEGEKEDDDDVLKYLKIRTHYAPGKDGADPKVVVTDEESEICCICQSEFEHEENIGELQCGHEYHTDCVKQWLLRKKDCPMCRASVLPS